MINTLTRTAAIAIGTVAVSGALQAQRTIFVSQDVTTSTTWTANNTYNLLRQIYVKNGATLTIEGGTVVASTTNVGGSLAVTRGSKIEVQGTDQRPVIMTSTADVATWTGGDPKTGRWREGANEWGNLTIMGRGYISENAVTTNVPTPNPNNFAPMEGLIAAGANDPNVLYGGGDDDDDSGSISYLSIRYGGKVIALNDELNGLSLGGIGRDTDIHHVEIMNNVDDGIEIWGGAVNLRYFSIWNVGDDSFDVDQGWRGKAQFGLVVQGYSLDAPQGSGVGDNGFEMDGAEDSNWQPVTTAKIANCTFIGQPTDGDGATAWRDNARVQFHNSIFMDCGEKVVRFDNVDGDGANGYGFNGTLSWAQTWTTPYSATSTVNAPPNPSAFYRSQSSGNLIEIRDTVFFNNNNGSAYTEADARGVFAATNYNVRQAANSPVTSVQRGGAVVKGGKVMNPVTFLDPRPQNDALTPNGFVSPDGFFSGARYRGAFAPGNNWLVGWTASSAFGMTERGAWQDLGTATAGANGDPVFSAAGTLAGGTSVSNTLSNFPANAPVALAFAGARGDLPIFGGTLVPNLLTGFTIGAGSDGSGNINLSYPWPVGVPSGQAIYVQALALDAGAPQQLSFSNALVGVTP